MAGRVIYDMKSAPVANKDGFISIVKGLFSIVLNTRSHRDVFLWHREEYLQHTPLVILKVYLKVPDDIGEQVRCTFCQHPVATVLPANSRACQL